MCVCVCVRACVCDCDLPTALAFTGKTYYIDPNGGSPADAIEVVCKKSEEEVWTCIPPTVDEIVSPALYFKLCGCWPTLHMHV